MRLMETIRRKGGWWILGFLAIFLVSVFAGLGVGMFQFNSSGSSPQQNPDALKTPLLVDSGELADVAMRVNGRKIATREFNEYLNRIMESMKGSFEDPSNILEAYAFAASRLTYEEIVRQRGEELGVKVTNQDIEDQKSLDIQAFLPEQKDSSGNVIADLTRGLGSARERKAAFTQFLSVNGLTEDQWVSQTRSMLFLTNTNEYIQEQADAAKRLESEEKKVKVDEELANGELFQEVVRKYSDDPSAEIGGDIGTWTKRGLLNPEVDDQLFILGKDEMTGWIEVPVGFQKFYVYAVEMPEGEELEQARQDAIAALKEGKDEDYQPTEEEISEKVEYDNKKIKYYFIQLSVTEPNVAYTEMTERLEQATIEINEPLVLAQQALSAQMLQPMSSTTFEDLKQIAMNSALDEGYDFSLIQEKLDAGKPKPKTDAAAADSESTEKAEDDAAADEGQDQADEAAADAEAGDDAAADAEAAAGADTGAGDSADADEEETTDFPIYALGIGLLKQALSGKGESGATFANYMIAKTYLDWLEDDTELSRQPLDRDKAREEAEENFARAVERFNYSPQVYANRGLNLAWLDNKDLASQQLGLAMKYAPNEAGGVWDTIREAFEVLDDQAGLDAVDERLSEIRKATLEQALRQNLGQPGTSPDNPIQLNLDDMIQIPAEGENEEGGGETEDGGSADEPVEPESE